MQNEQIISFISDALTDTSGAIHMLPQRAEKSPYSADTLRYHVLQGNLPAYVFEKAQLVRWTPGMSRRGQSYFFLKEDVRALALNSKAGRKPKTDEEKQFSE